jgi:CheY-like chemotaxis protein
MCMCIIADTEVRTMSGLDLLHHIRSSTFAVPLVVITGKPSEIPKPFILKEAQSASSESLRTVMHLWI